MTDKEVLKSKIERLNKRRERAILEKDWLKAEDLYIRIERAKYKLSKL
jgi:hypothetical protein|tara:strand:+ start:85 stop:228 length:144 start_codon:yes stop_codon:yes gene_type:complete